MNLQNFLKRMNITTDPKPTIEAGNTSPQAEHDARRRNVLLKLAQKAITPDKAKDEITTLDKERNQAE